MSEPGPNMKRRRTINLWIIGIFVALVVGFSIWLGGLSKGAQQTSVVVAPTTAAVVVVATKVPTDTPAPTATAKALTWQELTRFEGAAIKDTETFTISADEWRIVWDTRPGQYGAMNFQIYVYKAGGSKAPVSVAANVIGAGKDTSVIRGKGDYYLTINTGQPYTIAIEERR